MSERNPTGPRTCPGCDGQNLYSNLTSAGNGRTSLLPGLGGFLRYADFRVVVCADCGLTRFYAEYEARKKAAVAYGWQSVNLEQEGQTT